MLKIRLSLFVFITLALGGGSSVSAMYFQELIEPAKYDHESINRNNSPNLTSRIAQNVSVRQIICIDQGRTLQCGSNGLVRSRQIVYRADLFCAFQQVQRRQNALTLAFAISRSPQRSPQQMRCCHHPGERHLLQLISKGTDGNNYGCDAGCFRQSGNVSHGHVAHGSDRHQQGGLDPVRL